MICSFVDMPSDVLKFFFLHLQAKAVLDTLPGDIQEEGDSLVTSAA